MSILNRCVSIFLIVGLVLANTAHSDKESQRQTLPRSFGPLMLGMTEQAFTKVTGLKTYACECAKDEYTAWIDAEKFPNVFPGYIYSLPKDHRSFSTNFYKGKLYLIDLPSDTTEIEVAKKKYIDLYGPPSKSEDWQNGVSWIKWENKTTVFELAYNREKSGAFFNRIPAGTVSFVRYVDKSLRDALEEQEKKHSSRPRH